MLDAQNNAEKESSVLQRDAPASLPLRSSSWRGEAGIRKWIRRGLIVGLLWVAAYYGVPSLMPIPAGLTRPPTPSVEITDMSGSPLRKLLQSGRRIDPPLRFSDLPRSLTDATISAEDQ